MPVPPAHPPPKSVPEPANGNVLRVVVRGFARDDREVVAIVLEQCARDVHAALHWATLEVM